MPPYPYMPMYGGWAPPYPGNPYGPVLATPPPKSAKALSTAPPKPPVPSVKAASIKKGPPTEEKVALLKSEVHYINLHPTVAKLKSVKCGESSPGGDRIITMEEWQKFCNATDGTKKVDKETSLKNRKLAAGPEGAKAKSVQSADFGSDFKAFLEWNALRREAKKAQQAADAKLAVKVDKTASEVAKSAKAKSEKPAAQSEKSAAHTTASNHYAPPSLRPGMNYLFQPKTEHTMHHVFNKTSKIWDAKYAGSKQAFKIFKVATNFTVGGVIAKVRGDKEKAEGWAVTEVVEAGGGSWKRGTTINYGDDKAGGSLASMGWDQTRGTGDRPPVWLVVHKA